MAINFPNSPSNGDSHEGFVYNSTKTVWESSADAVEIEKAYRYTGTLATNTGEKRFYMHKAVTLTGIYAYVKTAPSGAALNLALLKNGTSLQTFSIAADTTTGSSTGLTHSISAGDYFTVNITQVGSSTAGEELYVVFTFN